jgi:hypothetical protein
MTDLLSSVAGLRRPRTLIQAARHGLDDYSRTRDLVRVMRTETPPSPDRAVAQLLDEEERIEDRRLSGDASYSITRHIEVLIAMMAEARLLDLNHQFF